MIEAELGVRIFESSHPSLHHNFRINFMKHTLKLFAILALILNLMSTAHGQKGTVKGRVIDERSNEPLPFTNIVIFGTQQGVVSDLNGDFILENLSPGFTKLAASQVGYEPYVTHDFMVTNSKSVYIEIALKPRIVDLEKVEIKASPFHRNSESPLSMQSLDISEIEKNPGGNRDISKVIQALPGVASSVSYRNDIIVRGGGSSENRFYIDGVEIPNLNHFATQGASGGPVGIINVDFIREVDFYSGAFPANRGNALSSVLEMTQIDGNKDKMVFKGAVGASDLALTLNGPISKNSSLLFSVRRSYLQFLFDAIGLPFLPTYNDYQIKYKYKINQKNELTFISLGALDQFKLNLGIENPNEDQRYILGYLPVNNQWNYTVGIVYKHFRKNGFDTWVLSRNMLRNKSYKYADNDESKPENLIQDYVSDEIENKFRFERNTRFDGYKLVFGVGAEYARYKNNTFQKSYINNQLQELTYNTSLDLFKSNLFAQVSKSYLDERLTLSLGLRTDMSDYDNKMQNPLNQVSPRFSATYTLTEKLNLNFNTGRFYQLPSYTTLGFKNNENVLINKANEVSYLSADHFVAGLEYAPNINSRVSLEGFMKNYHNYPVSVSDSVALASKGADYGIFGTEEVLSAAKGRAYGFEILARTKDLKGFNLILSYTYVRSEFTGFSDEYVPSAWDNRHILNFTMGKKLKRNWDIGMKWRYVGGSPYTPYDMETSSNRLAWDTRKQGYLDYSRFNTERFRAFHQLDIRIDKTWFLNKWTFQLYMDVQNLYNFKSEQQDFLTNLSPEGIPQIDPANPNNYLLRSISNSAGQILPTIGIIVEI